MTFPSLTQTQARAPIDPSDGPGANLPGDRQERRYFTPQSDAITLKINTFWIAADLGVTEDRWEGLFARWHKPARPRLFIKSSGF